MKTQTMTVAQIAEATGGRIAHAGNTGTHLERVSTDTRTIGTGDIFVALRGDNFDGHDFAQVAVERGACCLVLEEPAPDIAHSVAQIIVPDTLKALGDIAEYWRTRNAHVPLVSIVGSMGKTTTKEMLLNITAEERFTLGTMGNLNNLIGAPLMLSRLRSDHMAAVLELGMNTPGELSRLVRIAQPDIVLLTNIRDAHIGNFESPDALYYAKCEALENAPSHAVLLICADDVNSRRAAEEFAGTRQVVTFGYKESADVRAENITPLTPYGYRFNLILPETHEHTQVELHQFGRGHILNALGAAAAAHELGIPPRVIAAKLSAFSSGAARAEVEEMNGGWYCIKDYYNASPTAMCSALNSMNDFHVTGNKYAVLGDMMELGEYERLYHTQVGEVAAQSGLAWLHTCGERGKIIARGAKNAGMKNVTWHESAAEAANAVYEQIEKGDLVLIKASRLMRLEQVYEILKNDLPDTEGTKG